MKKGFTLIELLVVISIIGLLSSIVLASVRETRTKAEIAKFKEDMISVRNALELYRADYGYYPGGVDVPFNTIINNELAPYIKNTVSVPQSLVTTDAEGINYNTLWYINSAQIGPLTGGFYSYCTNDPYDLNRGTPDPYTLYTGYPTQLARDNFPHLIHADFNSDYSIEPNNYGVCSIMPPQ